MEKYISALSWRPLDAPAACCRAGMQGTPPPHVMVTVETVAWEVTAATDRIREADSGSSLRAPPLFSCRTQQEPCETCGGWTE